VCVYVKSTRIRDPTLLIRHVRALTRLIDTIVSLTQKLGRDPYTREVLRAYKSWGYGHKMLKLAEGLGLITRYDGVIKINGKKYRCVFNKKASLANILLSLLGLTQDETDLGEDEDD